MRCCCGRTVGLVVVVQWYSLVCLYGETALIVVLVPTTLPQPRLDQQTCLPPLPCSHSQCSIRTLSSDLGTDNKL